MQFFEAYLNDLFQIVLDPTKRMFWGYLLCAFVIALVFLMFAQKTPFKSSLQNLFSKKVWLSASAKADYKITLINHFVLRLLSPLLFSQLALATAIFFWFYEIFPERPMLLATWSDLCIGLVFTLSYFLLDDFARFYVHRLLHRWPLLWNFHKVHHTAERLTPVTVLRTHPVESVIFSLRSVLTQGVAIGFFVFFLGERADLVTILGANVFVFFFNIVGSNLRHSHIHIRYWRPLEKIFVSPAQHQIHHSIEELHWDKNYGVALAIWDSLFGSLHHSEHKPPKAFGVRGCKQHDFTAIYVQPFADSWVLLCGYAIDVRQKARVFFRNNFRKVKYERTNESL